MAGKAGREAAQRISWPARNNRKIEIPITNVIIFRFINVWSIIIFLYRHKKESRHENLCVTAFATKCLSVKSGCRIKQIAYAISQLVKIPLHILKRILGSFPYITPRLFRCPLNIIKSLFYFAFLLCKLFVCFF